jgi:anti-sigma-K factor RskA
MICAKEKQGAEILMDYCAGALDANRAATFEEHLEVCEDCRRLVQAQREVWEKLDRWTPPAVSPDFDARLYARIAREEASSSRVQWWRTLWTPAVSLAAACAVLAVAFLVRVPQAGDSAKQIRTDKVDIEQVEQTLEDLDILAPAS